ncbi:MAG: hypothetical protein HYY16_04620 [Planctomycetes bacterium]|nr:hypothetical protein [Planctomycetota bacterium]
MPLSVGRSWLAGLLCALPALASGKDANVYYGLVEGAQKPAEIVAARVFERISEYQEIKRRGLTKDDPEYWVLLNKANDKFYRAVKKVAEESKYDVVVEKGTVKFDGEVPDVTQRVIDALEK